MKNTMLRNFLKNIFKYATFKDRKPNKLENSSNNSEEYPFPCPIEQDALLSGTYIFEFLSNCSKTLETRSTLLSFSRIKLVWQKVGFHYLAGKGNFHQ